MRQRDDMRKRGLDEETIDDFAPIPKRRMATEPKKKKPKRTGGF